MRRAIEVYAFLVRLLNFDDEVITRAETALQQDSGVSLEDLHNDFYKSFQEGFCREGDKTHKALRPPVNVHVFSHLSECAGAVGAGGGCRCPPPGVGGGGPRGQAGSRLPPLGRRRAGRRRGRGRDSAGRPRLRGVLRPAPPWRSSRPRPRGGWGVGVLPGLFLPV